MLIACGIVGFVDLAVMMVSGTVKIVIIVPMGLPCHVRIVAKDLLIHRGGYRFLSRGSERLPKMIDKTLLPLQFSNKIQQYRCGSGTMRMNLALDNLPVFSGLSKEQNRQACQSGIIFAPSLNYMDQAFYQAKHQGYSKSPIIEMLIPSTIDNSLAPKGKHVASLFCQHFEPNLPQGQNWDTLKDKAIDAVFSTIESFAPGFKNKIIAHQCLTPSDLESILGLTGGDIFHGRLTIDQLYSARPLQGYSQYKGPFENLYMCGSGTHPGGGVSGMPGHNCAHAVLNASYS